MIKIHKYALDFSGFDNSMNFEWPKGTRILKAGVQKHSIFLWVEFDDLVLDSEQRNFVIHGTGHEVPNDGRVHIDTVFVDPYVWHIYELKEQS